MQGCRQLLRRCVGDGDLAWGHTEGQGSSTLITDKIHLLISLGTRAHRGRNRIITIFQTGQRGCGDPVVAIHFGLAQFRLC